MKKLLAGSLLMTASLLGCASGPSTSVSDRPIPSVLSTKSASSGPTSSERIETSLESFETKVRAAQR